MNPNFMQSTLPPVYKRSRGEAYIDPIRQRLIFVTPEENVRQHMIAWLLDELDVPKRALSVGESLKNYGIASRQKVDIIVKAYDNTEKTLYPVAVIECKPQDFIINDAAVNQLFKRVRQLKTFWDCEYCALTNGRETFCYQVRRNKFGLIGNLPKYREMLGDEYSPVPIDESRFDVRNFIGEDTPESLQIPMANFWECLLDVEHKMPARRYKIFRLVEDCGVRNLSVDGRSDSPYRSFIVEYNGDTTFVSIAVSSYVRRSSPKIFTAINVAVDEGETVHNSLELVVDNNVEVVGNRIKIFHDWRMTNGSKGAVATDTMRTFVSERYPQIRHGDRCFLGTLTHDRFWSFDDSEVVHFVENLISYALIRDDLKAILR